MILNGLEQHLSAAGSVTRPGDPGWDLARMAWNVAVEQKPVAVVAVGDAADVATVVTHAAAAGLAVSAQPGGHGASAALDGTVMLRTAALQEITIDVAAKTARVGAGVKWGTFLPGLEGTGLIALAGSSPDISIVGYLLGGGISWFSRKYGPASRSVRAIDLVTTTGVNRRVTADSDPELFWALRGGGGEFGIVTAIEFDLYAEPALVGGKLMFPGHQATAVLNAVAELQAVAPRELALWAGVMHFPPLPDVPEPLRGNTFAVVDLTFLGSLPALDALLYTIRDAGTVVHDTVAPVRIGSLGDVAAEPVDPMPSMDFGLALRRFDAEVIDLLVAVAGAGSGTAVTLFMVRHLGGAMAEPGHDGVAGAVDEQHLLFALGVPADADRAAAIEVSFAEIRKTVGDDGADRVPFNFLGHRGIGDAYPPADIARLQAIKRAVDPAGTFRSNRPLAQLGRAGGVDAS